MFFKNRCDIIKLQRIVEGLLEIVPAGFFLCIFGAGAGFILSPHLPLGRSVMVCQTDQTYLASIQDARHWYLMVADLIVTSTRLCTKATGTALASAGTTVVGRRLVSGTYTVTHCVWSVRSREN